MIAYQEVVRNLLENFEQVCVELIPRNSNSQADALARLVTSEHPAEMKEVIITRLTRPLTVHSLIAIADLMDIDDTK